MSGRQENSFRANWRGASGALAAGLLATWLSTFSMAVWSQQSSLKSTSLKGFQMVQRVDDVLYGVDAVSLEILNQRHVQGTFVRVSADQPSPILGYTRFVADCREPIRISLVSSSNLNGKTHPDGSPQYIEARADPRPPDEMEYSEGDYFDGTKMVAEFACRSTTQPGAAREIAEELFERGGPPDMLAFFCVLKPDGSNKLVPGVEVRYSASAQAVVVDDQWMTSSVVTRRTLQFGSGYDKWVIDRRNFRARLVTPNGSVRYTGTCRL